MFNSTQVKTLHNVVPDKNDLIKLLRETNEILKAQLMERSKLKPSDTQKNLHNCHEKIAQLNIEEAFITILRFSQNDY